MIVISPWSKGGYVNSQVFDHTSLIRFIEAPFCARPSGLLESEHHCVAARRRWATSPRRSISSRSHTRIVTLPGTRCVPPTQDRYPDYVPPVPANQALPTQESGTRPARPVPYDLHVHGEGRIFHAGTHLPLGDREKPPSLPGCSGDSSQSPWTYTVGTGDEVSES